MFLSQMVVFHFVNSFLWSNAAQKAGLHPALDHITHQIFPSFNSRTDSALLRAGTELWHRKAIFLISTALG